MDLLSLIRKSSFVIIVIVSVVALTGLGCRRPSGNGNTGDGEALIVWGLWQDSEAMEPILKAFEDQTGVTVEYRKVGAVANYEKNLLEAIAEGRGPDVFVVHHTWIEGKRRLMSPAPTDVVNENDLDREFVSVVKSDLSRDGLVYALPTSVDTLALYYNVDLLNSAGVARIPRTWQEFQEATSKITKVNRLGAIEQSAAALGTASNVNRAGDILQLLMLQSGLTVLKPDGTSDISSEIGQTALTFYTDFSNKTKKVYTWDLQQDYSIDAFAEGETAMMFNYSYHLPTIKAKNPRLQFEVAPMPQIADSNTSYTFANYWPFAVSASSRAPLTAWQFLRFMTSSESSITINTAQQAPPAQRDVIAEGNYLPQLQIFAQQSLQATTWPRYDIVAIDAIFNTMIDNVVTGQVALQDALRQAEDQLEQLGNDESI